MLNFREIFFIAIKKNTKNYIPAESTYAALSKLFIYQKSDQKVHLSTFKYQRDSLPFFCHMVCLLYFSTYSEYSEHWGLFPPVTSPAPQNSGIK